MVFLPEAIWKRRLQSECEQMQSSGEKFSCNSERTQYDLDIVGKGFELQGGSVVARNSHKARVTLLRSFPYAGGVDVVWLTPIFHPNIREDNGKVCIQLLNNWGATQSVALIAKALKQLLENPNVNDPLDKLAAEYFAGKPLQKQLPASKPGLPRLVG